MPGTAVASRQNAWARIKHRYRIGDANKSAAKQARAIQTLKDIAARKGAKNKK
jgi:hypothetical protein